MSMDTPTEDEMLDRITTGLDRECARRDISLTPGDAIKRQKYVDLVLFDYLDGVDNPPVTMSWYKYGLTTPNGGGGTSMATPETTTSPSNQSDRAAEFLTLTADDFAEFYRQGQYTPSLDHANEDTLEFLRLFYKEHAPERFRELYLVNVRLREAIQNLRIAVDPSAEYTSTQSEVEQEYHNVIRLTSQLELILNRNRVFAPVVDIVPEFFRLVEQTFAGIAPHGDAAPAYDRFTYVTMLEEFYDEAWGQIAHCVSQETAAGPGADQLHEWSDQALSEFEEPFMNELDELKSECIRVGAFPSPSAYPSRTGEPDETLEELLRVASQPAREADGEAERHTEGDDQ